MEIKKLTQEELQQIQDIQNKTQSITVELGHIELLKIQLKLRRDNAEGFLKELGQEEKVVVSALEAAYGKGSIDLEKGEFVPLVEDLQPE